jgi:hypothetical protein
VARRSSSFGWELAIGRLILWQCKGPTFGLDPGSFHAESYGMLSVLLFLEFYIQFFQVSITDSIEHLFYCDKQGLVNRISASQDRSWKTPNHCIASKADLEMASSTSLNVSHLLLPSTVVSKDIRMLTLPWEAQMNCHAD